MATATSRGYTATKDQLLTRLRRIEGQVRGGHRVEDGAAAKEQVGRLPDQQIAG